LLCGPEDCIRWAAVTGDKDLMGGVPKLGGVWPIEFDRAAASADIPGPGSEEWVTGPARGVRMLGGLVPVDA
jgi:hypothetical protein